LEHKDNQIKSS